MDARNTTTRAEGLTGASAVHTTDAARAFPRISWGAIMAGAVLALVMQLLLQMLGAGIGLSTIDPMRPGDTPSAATFGTGAGIWWAVGGLISAFVGGWLAGKLAGVVREGDGAWHGLLSWAVSTLVTAYVLSTAASSLLGGAANIASTTASTTATAAAAAASNNPNAAAAQAGQAASAARDVLSSETTQQRAREVADATAKNASRGLLWAFLALALGSLLASLGGRSGGRPRVR